MKLRTAQTVAPTVMPMIWRDRIPMATLSVIAGKPGLGKSTLATMVAAELSQGGHAVIVSNLEDDLSSVLRPRLEVAGAALDRVHLVPPDDAPFFPRDLGDLEEAIVATRAAAVILDPIAAHFQPERRVHDRPTLRQLIGVARRTRCAIIGVHHTIKTALDGTALGAVGGPTGGLAGTARAVYVYGYDPSDVDQRALACAKINGVDEPPTLVFAHETVDYDAAGQLSDAGQLRIVGEIDEDAKRVLRRGRKWERRDAACSEWLTLYLGDGEDMARPVRDVRLDGGLAGYGWQTLRRAAIRMQVEKHKRGFGPDGYWLWRLPDAHPLREQLFVEDVA